MSVELDDQEKKIAARAASICAASEHCNDDISKKLLSWCSSNVSMKRILDYLNENDYINESRYVKAFCEGKLRQLKWGKTKIAYQLRMKRIDESVIEEGLLQIDMEEYRQILTGLVVSKWRTMHESDEFLKRSKVISFLQSRGFEPYEVQKVLDTIND